jgi:hypothetical protein
MNYLKKRVGFLLAIVMLVSAIVPTFTLKNSDIKTSCIIACTEQSSGSLIQKSTATLVKRVIEFIISKVGPKVKEKIWPVVKDKVDDVLKAAKGISIKGPGSGERVFAIYKNKVEVFRLDATLLKKYDGYYIYVHYHASPKMSNHHDISTFYLGKNKPRGW